MRLARLFFSLLLIVSTVASAAELRIRITDPQGAALPNARVTVYKLQSNQPLAVVSTNADGYLEVKDLVPGKYRVEVSAPGFAVAERTLELPITQPTLIALAVAPVPQTVAVTATATPVTVEQSGISVSSLGGESIQLLNPPDLGDTLRFVPGAVVASAGRTGSLSTLFVRGGESRYNKVLIDGVPVNDAGGTFDFGVVPMQDVSRLELLRGSASTLYGSDAMTSVVQLWTEQGTTRTPELRFGADGGTFATAHGYASLSGARNWFDYNLFGDQFNTSGQGTNDEYSNSSQGANLGARLSRAATLRFRIRHNNSRTGVPSNWWFNGAQVIPPDSDGYARQNNTLASLDLNLATGANWLHQFSVFEYNHQRRNKDDFSDPGRPYDDPFDSYTSFNRAGFRYQSDYTWRNWAHSAFGYYFEDENGFIDASFESFGFPGSSHTHGVRRNQAVFGEQFFNWKRVSLLGGLRFEHNESFGNKAVPRAALTILAFEGGEVLSGTRFRFSYAEGIKAPTFEESFGVSGSFPTDPNPDLKPEKNRALEAGFEQKLFGSSTSLSAVYFNNRFTDQIQFTFSGMAGQYINVNSALAHGAEVTLSSIINRNLRLDGGYVYTSTQALAAPLCAPGTGCTATGDPLLRRPKHAGNLLLSYVSNRWGGSVGVTAVGRRPDSDFFTAPVPVDHAAGYGRLDLGGWYRVNRFATAYVNVGNATNQHYNDVVGYPGLRANFRAGMHFRVGGD